MEAHEEIVQAAKREIREETNLEVELGPVVDFCDFERDYYLDKEKKEKMHLHGKGLKILAYYKSGEVKLDKEHDSFEWISISEAIDKLSGSGLEGYVKKTLMKTREYLELKNSLDGWKRCQADFENYKKRQQESMKDAYKYACEGIAMEILPVIDNFYTSTEHVPTDQKNNPWVTGIMHIQSQLEKVLEDNNVVEIKIKPGDKFDPVTMEAIKSEQETKEKCKNIVKQVIIRGYKIGERVIRAAKVIVE